MQTGIAHSGGFGSTVLGKFRALTRSELWTGLLVVVVAVAILATVAVLYVNPPNRKSISFETTDAAAVSVGQDVRIAGISVGKVSTVSLEAESIKVDAEIQDDVAVGDESKIEVRMLTPVGGYAVTIIPMGKSPNGSLSIPKERVSVPYSIGDVLQAAPIVTDEVDGSTVDANIDQVATALQQNSGSIESMLGGLKSIARVMDEQRQQVARVADLASEYLGTFNANRDFVFNLIQQVDVVLTTYHNNSAGFNQAYFLLGDVLERLRPLEEFYLNHKDLIKQKVDETRSAITDLTTTMGPALDNLSALRDQLMQWITPEGMREIAGSTLLSSDICIPVAGKVC